MELRGLLQFLELLQSTESTGHVTERRVGRKRQRIECILRFFSGIRSPLIFPDFDLRTIFRGENLTALQIFLRVDVLGFFLLRLFARPFLFCGFGNVLRVTLRGHKDGATEK